jgi:5-methylcytosine-specific restriction protein A
MPTAPKRLGAPTSGVTRQPAHKRGYGHDWTDLRAWWIQRQPLCQDCLEEGVTNCEQIEVDHVIPFRGVHDPLRLDVGNLRSRCKRHHQLKTRRDYR